jgi:hypothetical protein
MTAIDLESAVAPAPMRRRNWWPIVAAALAGLILGMAIVLLAGRTAPVSVRVGFVMRGATAFSATIDGREVNADGETVALNPRVVVLTVEADDQTGQCAISINGAVVVDQVVSAPNPTTCMWLAPRS